MGGKLCIKAQRFPRIGAFLDGFFAFSGKSGFFGKIGGKISLRRFGALFARTRRACVYRRASRAIRVFKCAFWGKYFPVALCVFAVPFLCLQRPSAAVFSTLQCCQRPLRQQTCHHLLVKLNEKQLKTCKHMNHFHQSSR